MDMVSYRVLCLDRFLPIRLAPRATHIASNVFTLAQDN